MLDLYVLIFAVLVTLIMGLVIVSRNYKIAVNKLYGIFSLVVIFWSIANYFSNHAPDHYLLIVNKLSFLAGFYMAGVPWILSLIFPVRIKKIKTQLFIGGLVILIVTILSPTSLLVSGVEYKPEKQIADVTTGNLYAVYLIGLVIILGFLIRNFIKSYRSKESTKLIQQQISYIAAGVIATFLWIAVTTALVPAITGDWTISKLGLFGPMFLVGFMGLAIVRHKLFDVRLIIARTLGYLFTITTLISLYVIMIFILSESLLGGVKQSVLQQFVYIVATLVFGFSLPPLKKFFDRLTNRLFYQDAYDVQVFLDEFNKTLVGNIDIQPLLRQSAELIETTLKAESCVFEIHSTESSPRRLIGSKSVELSEEEVSTIMSESENIHQDMIIADELTDTHSSLKTLLSKNNIAILSQLNSAVKKTKDLGYLVLGQKKSGNPYNKQDLQVLEIISNELVIAVQNALRFEEIQEFTVTLQEKVEDRTKELRKANEKLKALDETKDEFISMASHQLRTPLTAVKGYLSMVVEGDAGKVAKPQKELLDQAFASSQRMVYLIADLLNVSRLKTGKFVIENKATQLAEVVESEMHQLKEMAASKNQTLTFNKPAKFPAMMLDETKMRQVIMNFADNALHYTPNDGHIQLNLVDKPESIEYTVVDDGLGVPKIEQHHLFTKFYRANNAKKARPDGTGLGLFMAKKVIIAQGGAVIFSSEENKGSTFGFTIPKNAKTVASKQNASVKK